MNASMGGYPGVGVGRDEGDHPWLTTSRWGKTWRVWLCVLAVWVSWLAIANLIIGGGGNGAYGLPDIGYTIGLTLVPPTFCAALAAVSQRWLTRFVPFTQSLLFGVLAYAAGLALITLLALVWLASGPACAPGEACAVGIGPELAATVIMLLPTIILAALGYGVALATVTRRGKRVALWLTVATGGVLAVFAVALISQGTGGG